MPLYLKQSVLQSWVMILHFAISFRRQVTGDLGSSNHITLAEEMKAFIGLSNDSLN